MYVMLYFLEVLCSLHLPCNPKFYLCMKIYMFYMQWEFVFISMEIHDQNKMNLIKLFICFIISILVTNYGIYMFAKLSQSSSSSWAELALLSFFTPAHLPEWKRVKKIHSRRWGSSLPGLHMLDPPLGPPTYPKLRNPRTTFEKSPLFRS